MRSTTAIISKSILTVVFILIIKTSLIAQNPFIPKYDAVKRSERCFTVTIEEEQQFGSVWWREKVDFSQDTLFNFVVYMGSIDGDGADGIAFVMHQDPRDTFQTASDWIVQYKDDDYDVITNPNRLLTAAATGDPGGGLGYGTHHSNEFWNQKITPSVAIEFDTYDNNDYQDGKGSGPGGTNSAYDGWDHTSVVYNGDLYNQQQMTYNGDSTVLSNIHPLKPAYAFGTAKNPDGSVYHNIEDDRCYTFQVRWVVNSDGTQTLELWADIYDGTTNTSGLKKIMTHTDDMLNKVFGGNPIMRFGFTGSTGGKVNEQTICLLGENLKPFAQDDYDSVSMNTPAVVDIESNDNDPDGDELYVPIIITPPANGTAVVFDSAGVNYMRYTPVTNYKGVDTVTYMTCDVNSTKCYAKCDTAKVVLNIGCEPFLVDVTKLGDHVACQDSIPGNGAAQALASPPGSAASLWYESFSDLPNKATEDTGLTSWTSTTPTGYTGEAQINGNRFWVKGGSGGEVVWESEIVDVSSSTDVGAKIVFESDGSLDVGKDSIMVMYKLDGGPEQLFSTGVLRGNFVYAEATVNGLSGSTMQIVIRFVTTNSSAKIYVHYVDIVDNTKSTAPVKYLWFDGPTADGDTIYSGAINNGLKDGYYTVIAQDVNTGCLSLPGTVYIDSTGTTVDGGYIKQIHAFTNCEMPYDGELEAGVFDGLDSLTLGYTFYWYYKETPISGDTVAIGYQAQNLMGREYSVNIIEQATGCDVLLTEAVPNLTVNPTVTAIVEQNIVRCDDPFSGIVSANVGGNTDGYIFNWYFGNTVKVVPDSVGATIAASAQSYTVQAKDTSTRCVSDPQTVTVVDITAVPSPLVVTVLSEQVSCDPLAPAGHLSAGVGDGSGGIITNNFTFNWYQGTSDAILARPGYTGGREVDSLPVGQYHLKVVNDTSGCVATLDTAIQDNRVDPTIASAVPTNVTTCATPPNGTITVSIDQNVADHELLLYSGYGVVPANLIATIPATNVFTNLDSGQYTVVARNVNTSCISDPEYIEIKKVVAPPTGVVETTDQESCIPSKFTGSVSITKIVGPTSNYTFEWFKDSIGGSVINTVVNDTTINLLDTGNYVLRLTNNTTACVGIFPGTVYPNISIPVIDSIPMVPSTYCSPIFNGELSATVDGGQVQGPVYVFNWIVADTLYANDSNVQTGLAPTGYRLVVTDTTTGCPSDTLARIVADNSVTPQPTIVTTINTSCDVLNPNGQMEVTAVADMGGFGLGDYELHWHNGLSSSAPEYTTADVTYTNGTDSLIIYGLGTDTVTLFVQNRTTMCLNEVIQTIQTNPNAPVFDAPLSISDATRCADPYMSRAEVTSISIGALSDYTFVWSTHVPGADSVFTTVTGPVIGDTTTTEFVVMPAGSYSVVAVDAFKCATDTLPFDIQDLTVLPAFTMANTPNSSCDLDPAMANGTITATYTGPGTLAGAVSSYDWSRRASGTADPWVAFGAASVASLSSVNSGYDYRLILTDSLACVGSGFTTVNYNKAPNPVIAIDSVHDLTICTIGFEDGALRVEQVSGFLANDHVYHLTDPSLTVIDQTNNNLFTDLINGNYSIQVENTFTHCLSNVIDTVVKLNSKIEFAIVAPKPPVSCIGNNGELLISAMSTSGANQGPVPPAPGVGAGFDFIWKYGINGDPLPGSVVISAPDLWSSEGTGMPGGYYTLNVTDRGTDCDLDTIVFLPSSSTADFLDPIVTNADQCVPGNGDVMARINPDSLGTLPSLAKADYTDYDYLIFEGYYFNEDYTTSFPKPVEIILGSDPSISGIGEVTFDSLAEGTYTIVALENWLGGNNCFSRPKTIDVGFDYNFPGISLNMDNPDSSCVGGRGTGVISENGVSIGPGGTGNQFYYSWYVGTDTTAATGTIIGARDNSLRVLDTLSSGNYTLVVDIDAVGSLPGKGCRYSDVVTVIPQADNYQLTLSPTDITFCSYNNGELYVNGALENGNGASLINYDSYKIYDAGFNDSTTVIQGSGTSLSPYTYLSPKSYFVTAVHTPTNCISQPARASLKKVAKNPVISVSVDSLDYNCNPSGNPGANTGQLSANIGGVTTGYGFEWYKGDLSGSLVRNTAVASGLTGENGSQLYTVFVEDTDGADGNLGCVSNRGVTLSFANTIVSINNPDLRAFDKTVCGTSNGAIEVNAITEDFTSFMLTTTPSYAVSDPTYDVRLLRKDYTIINPLTNPDSTFASFDPQTGTFSTVPPGVYYVQASNTKHGCAFGQTTQVIVKDLAKPPVVTYVIGSPDYSCAGGVGTGVIRPNVKGGSEGDTSIDGFSANWYLKGKTDSPATRPFNGITEAYDLKAGVYTLIVDDVKNLDNGCRTEIDITVTPAKLNTIGVAAIGTDQTVCYENGVIDITRLLLDNVDNPITSTGYSYELMDGQLGMLATNPSSSPQFGSLGDGTYFVRAVQDLTNCKSQSYQVILNDLSSDPIAVVNELSKQYSLNPEDSTWTGSLAVSATESDGSVYPQGFTYTWYKDAINPTNIISNNDTISQQDDALYYVNTISDSTGCDVTVARYIEELILVPDPLLNSGPQNICVPPDGFVEVESITLDNLPDNLSDYTFYWYYEIFDGTPDFIIDGNDLQTIQSSVPAGNYYVVAEEKTWLIQSTPKMVIVQDNTVDPRIEFVDDMSADQTSCDPAIEANGAIGVEAFDQFGLSGNHSYQWYIGTSANSTFIIQDSVRNQLTGQKAGYYTVNATNNNTGCQSYRTFQVVNDIVIPVVNVNLIPVTNCPADMANGVLMARVINSDNDHQYEWYTGTGVKPVPDYNQRNWQYRSEGFYTVRATDIGLQTCVSDPVTVKLNKETYKPVIITNEVNPITNCSPAKFNGAIYATAEGEISGFTFEWYYDVDSLYFVGPLATNLGDHNYIVRVINDITGCYSEEVVRPGFLLDQVPLPEVSILSDLTDCMNADGTATASVGGNIYDYNFLYYSQYNDSLLGNVMVQNELLGLDTGKYYLLAESRLSGCLSDTTFFEIEDQRFYHSFDIVTQPSNCIDPTGSARVIIDEYQESYNVIWYQGGSQIGSGEEIGYLPAGQYLVEVEGSHNCIVSEEFEVGGDIIIYNGVSPNGDGYNDNFFIDCIDIFVNNNVKIFNRAGQLLFEMDGYNPHDFTKSFTGIPNKGMQVGDGYLPNGTYFYVVDKGDGSKEVVGYLELNR